MWNGSPRSLDTADATRLCDREYDLTILGVSMYYARELSSIFHLFNNAS